MDQDTKTSYDNLSQIKLDKTVVQLAMEDVTDIVYSDTSDSQTHSSFSKSQISQVIIYFLL